MSIRDSSTLIEHYTPGNSLKIIQQALFAINKTPATVSIDDLAPMDEFHVGSREATQDLFDPLKLGDSHHLLDVGCGLGGPARFIAKQYGIKVTGVDLTQEFVDVGNEICGWMNLQDQVNLQQGDVMNLDQPADRYDGAYMIHVGMNIDNKVQLFKEIARVLKPGGFFAIFDLMKIGEGSIKFPVPWSGTEATSFVVSPDDYQDALEEAGLSITHKRNRHAFALEFYNKMKTKIQTEGPQAFGLHLLMGENTEARLTNAYQAVIDGTIAPVEMIAYKS